MLYHAQAKYAEAEPLNLRALAIWEEALGPDHPDVAQSLNNLAELYRVQETGLTLNGRKPPIFHSLSRIFPTYMKVKRKS